METILIKNSGDDMKRNIGPVMRAGKSPVLRVRPKVAQLRDLNPIEPDVRAVLNSTRTMTYDTKRVQTFCDKLCHKLYAEHTDVK